MNKVLSSYAILMVDGERNKNFTDYFIPFVAEAINNSVSDILTVDKIQIDIKKEFGLDIPLYVLNNIVKTKLLPGEYVTKKNNYLVPQRSKLGEFQITEKRNIALGNFGKLIEDIIQYANDKYQTTWTKDETAYILENFIKEQNYKALEVSIDDSTYDDNTKNSYIIASYIKFCHDNKSVYISYIEQLVRADMLANAVYFTDTTNVNMKFRTNTQIFFDTSFLIYALGLTGEIRKNPCMELIESLRKNKAVLKCFKHTVDEIKGILEGCKRKMSQGFIVDTHGTIEYFISKQMGPSDIDLIISNLDKKITNELNINVVTAPDTSSLGSQKERLKEELSVIPYSNIRALEKDVETITAIQYHRKNHTSDFVESCKALFVTTNNRLVHETRKAMRYGSTRIIPPVITDHMLMNLIWLKEGANSPDIPRFRLLADCYAALQPTEYHWKKYLEKIEQLHSVGDLDEDGYHLLKYHRESPHILMERTQGSEELLTFATIQEITELSKANITKDLREELVEQKRQYEVTQKELNDYQEQTAAASQQTKSNINKLSTKIATILINIVRVLICLFVIGAVVVSNFSGIAKWISVILIAILTTLSCFGISFVPSLNKLETKLQNFVSLKVYGLVYKED